MGETDHSARDALAAKMFPAAWATVANVPGRQAVRKRHNLRRQAETMAKLGVLRDAGAACVSCASFRKHPTSRGVHICDEGSDFHGYQLAAAGGLCTDWSVRLGADPDLLRHLTLAEAFMTPFESRWGTDYGIDAQLQAIRAAIARATGAS